MKLNYYYAKAIFFILLVTIVAELRADNKDIQTIFAILECKNTSQPAYLETQLPTENTNVVKYINHTLFMSPTLYNEVSVRRIDNKIQSAVIYEEPNKFDMAIQRVGETIKSIEIKGTSFNKHILEYNDEGFLVKAIDPSSQENTYCYEISYNDKGEISRIIYKGINVKKKKDFILIDKAFIRDGNTVSVKSITYNRIKALKFKQEILKEEHITFHTIPDKREYITEVKGSDYIWKTERTYNEQARTIKFVETLTDGKETKKSIDYEYDNNNLAKETQLIYVDGKFNQHNVRILSKFDKDTNQYLPLTDEDVFFTAYAENGEAILERKGKLTRHKENGVWGSWMYMTY